MEVKMKIGWLAAFVAAIICVVGVIFSIHQNDVQNFQIVQKPNGSITIRSVGGYYFAFLPEIWTYPKENFVHFSNDEQ